MAEPPYITDWLTALGTVGAVIAALALARWGDKLRSQARPRLRITITPASEDFQRLNANFGGNVFPTFFVRMSINNVGTAAAANVEVFAQRMRRKGDDGSFDLDTVFMPMNLRWSHTGAIVQRAVHPDVPKPCDLLMCPPSDAQAGAKDFFVLTEVDPVEAAPGVFPSRKPPGSYQIDLALSADDVRPVIQTIEIDWSGGWATDSRFFREDLRVRVLP